MRRLLVFLFLIAFLSIKSFVTGAATENSSNEPIELEIEIPISNPKPMRAPLHIEIEAIYDILTKTIIISYGGETKGEVRLYLNGDLIYLSSDINCVVPISSSGSYHIEIQTPNWTAIGDLCM